jgi:hypothetical protein
LARKAWLHNGLPVHSVPPDVGYVPYFSGPKRTRLRSTATSNPIYDGVVDDQHNHGADDRDEDTIDVHPGDAAVADKSGDIAADDRADYAEKRYPSKSRILSC